ncbi:DUF4062 domain-containing protein [Microbacterium aerolatum]|uniref:DUF4062 domain-containing protein n=1 Tax=Microbacterium aerolatum TaxID=153731 RepID=UPI0011BEA2CE|nr:DUF4062 domain-containing protein [Microbacterium aerolatum]
MTSIASVVYVMIASPSDVPEARDAVYEAIGRWNEANTRERGVVLVPLRWETGAVPLLGNHPQAIINNQLVERADVVVAIFGSRLGSATPAAISGTAEEIERAVSAGKPVHLYFSSAPRPNDVDPQQLAALHDFRSRLEQDGLLGTFASPTELTAHVWQAIEHDITQFRSDGRLAPVGTPTATAPPQLSGDSSLAPSRAGADLLVQGGSEREQVSDAKGRLRSRLHRWVDIVNRGSDDASDVSLVPVGQGVFLYDDDRSRTVHSGQAQRIPYELSLAAGGRQAFTVRWADSTGAHEKTFDV